MPTFDKQFYTDSVLESIEVHSPLSLSIHAESPLNRQLIYSITKGNDFEEFALDFNTGEHIFVSKNVMRNMAYLMSCDVRLIRDTKPYIQDISINLTFNLL